jgi:hypothetical protein
MRLHSEKPLIVLPGLVHLPIASFALVLVEGGAAMMVASTIGPCRISRPRSSSIAPTLVEQNPGQVMALQQMAKVQHRRRVRNRRHRQVDPGKATQRLAIVQRVFQGLVGQLVPPLQKWSRSIRSSPTGGRPRRTAADAPPVAPTAPPPDPSRPETFPAASASSCRRTPPAKSCPDAASPRPSTPRTGGFYPGPAPETGFFSVSLAAKSVSG